MMKSCEQFKNNEAVIDLIWKSKPAVARWCRMCYVLSEYLRYSAQRGDSDLDERKAFCRAIGYLSKSPKPMPQNAVVPLEEWNRLVYCTQQEVLDISRAFNMLLYRFREWAQLMDGDEEGSNGFPQKVWQFFENCLSEDIFKNVCGHKILRLKLFRQFEKLMRAPILVPLDQEFMPDMEEGSRSQERTAIEYLSRIAANSDILASDSLSAGQSRARVGTSEEISQENEIIDRYRTNGSRGLRGLVAAVLRESAWQLRGGHVNTEKGRRKCYSRVYEILHPSRRKRSELPPH